METLSGWELLLSVLYLLCSYHFSPFYLIVNNSVLARVFANKISQENLLIKSSREHRLIKFSFKQFYHLEVLDIWFSKLHSSNYCSSQ